MDTAVFEAFLPTISFVTVEIFALRIAYKISNLYERFLQRFLDYTDLDADPNDSGENLPKRPLLTKIALKTGGWAAFFMCASLAILAWALVMQGWFWVPPWFEGSWNYIMAGCVAACGITGLLTMGSALAAKIF